MHLAQASFDWLDAGVELARIGWLIVLPLLLMMGLGWLIQRRAGLEMSTLTRLNFHLVVPGMVYFALVDSRLALADVALVAGFHLLVMAVGAGLNAGVAAARGVPADQRRAMLMTSIFYNSGNYGVPLQELAFRDLGRGSEAAGLQVVALVLQNVMSFTLGVVLAAGRMGRGQWKATLLQIVRFPPIWALLAALVTIAVRQTLGGRDAFERVPGLVAPFWDALLYVKDGFVIIALVTLGAQLANVTRGSHRYPVTLSVALRLLAGPAIGLGLIYLLGIEGFTAQVLLISTAVPTSVNCLLLCMQFRNHPEFVARTVFYSTLLSPVTVAVTILLSRTPLVPGV